MTVKTSWEYLGVFTIILVFVALVTLVSIENVSAQNYYEGKTIRVVVSSSPGGGTDTAARLVTRFLPKYLPGNPSTIVQNRPGGGGTISNNYFYNRAKPDGYHLLQDSSSGLASFNRGGSRIKYNPRKYSAIGSIMRGGSILMLRKDARHRLLDKKLEPIVVGDTDGIRTWVAMTIWGAEFLGWNTRWIVGYKGTGEMILALRQGEIEFMATQNAKLINSLIKDRVVDPIAQQRIRRRKDFPNVPTFVELLGDKRPSGVSWKAYRVWSGPNLIDKFLMVPPGTPANVVAMLRGAFEKMTKNPQFKVQATNFFGNAWITRSGKETEKMIREVTDAPQEVKDYLRKMRIKYGLPLVKSR